MTTMRERWADLDRWDKVLLPFFLPAGAVLVAAIRLAMWAVFGTFLVASFLTGWPKSLWVKEPQE